MVPVREVLCLDNETSHAIYSRFPAFEAADYAQHVQNDTKREASSTEVLCM